MDNGCACYQRYMPKKSAQGLCLQKKPDDVFKTANGSTPPAYICGMFYS